MALKVTQKMQLLAAGAIGAFLVLTVSTSSTLGGAQDAYQKLTTTNADKVTQVDPAAAKNLESAIARAKLLTVILGLGSSVLILLSAIGIVKSLQRPLNALNESSKRFAIGDVELAGLDVNELRSLSERDDELGDIAKSFLNVISYQKEKIAIASEVAKGNLNIDPKLTSEHDGLGRALVQMHGNLNNLVLQLRATAEQVAQGSAQVSTASQSLAKGATSQAATLEEISAAVTEMTSQAKKNAENAVDASQSAATAQTAAEEGKLKIETTVTAMNDISTASQQISKVIKLIDDIAFQTNLLALNAAVEAARAGKHGKGFAVVADEVRNLASRSAKAARETSELIESSLSKVENGVKQAQSTAESFVSINNGVTQMSQALSSIVDSSNAQAGSAHEIAQGLNNVNNVTQQNTAAAEQNAAASEHMTGMADQLKNIVARFSVKGAVSQGFVSANTAKPTVAPAAPSAPKSPAAAKSPAAPKPSAAPKSPAAPKPSAPTKPSAASTPPAPASSSEKPATVAHKGASTRTTSGDTHASKGWGGTDKGHIPTVRPEEVLALDDEEFGKY